MARQDVKAGRVTSEYTLASVGLWGGLAAMFIGAAVAVVVQVAAGCVLSAGGAILGAVSVGAYQRGRAAIKAAAHEPPRVFPGGQVF